MIPQAPEPWEGGPDPSFSASSLQKCFKLAGRTFFARANTAPIRRRTASRWKWTSSRPRVLFMNDYPMDAIFEAWQSGEFPGQHLFGVSHFAEHGIGVQILPFGEYSDRRTAIKQRFGDLHQQLRILTWTSHYDILYSGSQYDTMLLSILRRMGLFRKHIVATMHHVPKGLLGRPSIFRFVFGSHDRLLCLSEDIQQDLVERVRVPRQKLNLVGWAVDLDFYKFEESPVGPPLALSAGKTKRELRHFGQGVRWPGLPSGDLLLRPIGSPSATRLKYPSLLRHREPHPVGHTRLPATPGAIP